MISCNQKLFSLSKIRRYIPQHVAILIYKALVMSKINYGGILCIGAAKTLLARLQKCQNRALRICFCANRYTSNIRLHMDANVLPLFLRRKLDVYKTKYVRMLSQERGSPVSHDRPITRFSSSRPPTFNRPNSVSFLNSVTYQAPKLWAELPSHVKNLNDSPYFDREVRKLIQSEMLQIVSL